MKDNIYFKAYEFYKKLPTIGAIVTALLSFAGAIVLGVWDDNGMWVFLGFIAGAILTFIVYWISLLRVSAQIVQIETTIMINKKLDANMKRMSSNNAGISNQKEDGSSFLEKFVNSKQ